MELALNLGWMAMATAMCWLWVHHARREGRGRLAQIVSLGLVLAMMFVVITMYDDMAMAQNPAEIRCFQREDDLSAHAHVHAPFHPAVLPRKFLSTCSALLWWAVSLSRLWSFPSSPPFRVAPLQQPDPLFSLDQTPGPFTFCSCCANQCAGAA